MTSAPALAKWGPYNNCGINEHCYAVTERHTHTLGAIAAEDNEVAIVWDWEHGGFYDQEQWASWPEAPYPEDEGWVEAGITEGGYVNCCTAYPFYATETQEGHYHEYETTGPVESGSGDYNYDLIQDTEQNGVIHVYWSGATNTADWFEVARYGGGRPVYIEHNEGGLEAATEDTPSKASRSAPPPTAARPRSLNGEPVPCIWWSCRPTEALCSDPTSPPRQDKPGRRAP